MRVRVAQRQVLISRSGAAGLLAAGALSLGLAAGCATPPPEESPTPQVRSVVLIVVDTLPAATLGCYGNIRETSPQVDRLAREGALFERVYAPSNWTVPATASLLTSLYPSEHGAEVMGEMRTLSGQNPPNRLDNSITTLAEILATRNFKTGLFSANPYLKAGFQQGYGASEIDRMSATALNDLAIAWLRGLSGEPFFLHLQYMDLHLPVEPPPDFAALFAFEGDDMTQDEVKNWAFGRGKDAVGADFEDYRRRKVALNDGTMRYVDTEIGRLLLVLEELGVLSDTLIVVTSDHGEEFWQHAAEEVEMGGDPRNVYGIGHGHAMYEEIVRVPLVFSGPGITEGARSSATWSLLDVAPTLLDMLGLKAPAEMRGRSLAPILGLQGEAPEHWEALLIESPAYGPNSTVLVAGSHKLISRSDGIELVFDLEEDPGERRNLAASDPDTTEELRDQMSAMMALMGGAPSAEQLQADDETTEQLRALGYVE
ncbi:MAG: sulfatase [Acidobacteriota bacterium]